ncbi:MAG: hypothetical protein HXM40_04735, partial [Stomatobaculum longum]|nr:hypothetical protein [Stomatobaculum longum]
MREKRENRENRVVGQTRQMDRGLFRRPLEFHPVRRSALIGATVALLSQFYFNVISSDFRISIAGAQEKDALLFWQGRWCRPLG